MGLTYEEAGVDIEAGEEAVEKMSQTVESTFTSGVLTSLGSFGGLFEPDLTGIENPVLVSGTDGVGTKLKVAFRQNKHDTIGIDLVAMCLNDILTQGAQPLFFLDYLASGQLDPEQAAEIVEGIAAGCKQADCALIGGETAEMPDFYSPGEYEMAGFAVGIADKQDLITGDKIKPGNKLIGLAADGIHSNGYSLVRELFFNQKGYEVEDYLPELGTTLGEELLTPTRIYVKPVLKLLEKYALKGIAHITGGGLIENLPRILPPETKAVIDQSSWPELEIFELIQDLGSVETAEMYRTFNMGLGLVLVVEDEIADQVVASAQELGETAYLVGEVVRGENGVEFI